MQEFDINPIRTRVPVASSDIEVDLESSGISLVPSFRGNVLDITASHVSCKSNKRIHKSRNTRTIDAVSLAVYCIQRLAEIRRINEWSHTPSAFSCLMSFIGFLASLVYEQQNETDAYPKFFHDYIKEMYCAKIVRKETGFQVRESGHPKNNSWGEAIYSLVRCGLLHNMNVTGKKTEQNQIKVVLTHMPFQGKGCRVYKFGSYKNARLVAQDDQIVTLVINVFDLCDAVQKAIIRMFQKTKVRASARRVLAQRPIIMQIS